MGIVELSQKYGRRKASQAINAAIRAEFPAGNEIIELGTKYSTRAVSAKNNPASVAMTPAEIYAEIYADLRRIRDIIGDDVARRYGIKTKFSEDAADESNQ